MGSAVPTRDEEEVVDPVCGEVFPPAMAVFESEHEGSRFWFCSKTCKESFDAAPGEHLEQGASS